MRSSSESFSTKLQKSHLFQYKTFLEKFTFVRETVLCWVFTLCKTARRGMGGVEELGNEVRRSQLGIKGSKT